jgi:alpha-1,2-mannosyltransferase
MIAASPDRNDAAIRSTSDPNPHARAVSNILLATVPVLLVVLMAWSLLHDRFSALDFRDAYWFGGHRVLAGQNPYLWTAAQFRGGAAFVYPALSAVLFAPTALLSRSGGSLVFTLLSACVAPATLALLRVRDWRVYAVTLVWLPVYAGWLTANESLFMALGLAGAWRWRDRPGVAGFLIAAMISLKPLLWPLALWLLATRRWRASAQTLVWGLVLNVVAWSIVGFGDIGSYLHAVSADTRAEWRLGFGIPALLGHLGVGRTAGMAVMLITSAVLIAAVLYSGLARRREVLAMTLTVALALVSSPLLWNHYLALLIVPLAILRPRLDWLWFLPVLMWICPPNVRAHLWQVAAFWLAGGVMLTALSLRAARLGAPSSRLFGMSWLTEARA